MHDTLTPNEFTGTDSERINRAIRAAAESGAGRITIPRLNQGPGALRDTWLLDSAILLPGDMTVVLDGCRLKLSDRCRDNFFRSANCGLGIAPIRPLAHIHLVGVGNAVLEGADRPRATGDSAKTLGVRSFGTDAGAPGESQTGDWRNIGILLASVSDFSISGLTIRDSHCWAVSLEYGVRGAVRGIRIDSTGQKVIDGAPRTILNQDGIDLRQGCQDILIEDISGRSGDDLIALTGIPHAGRRAGELGSTMVSAQPEPADPAREAICRVLIRNVRGYCCGHHIVRLLNTSGIRLHDIVIDGLVDASPPDVRAKAAVKIGDNNPVWGGVTPLGDTSRIVISNVISRCRYDVLIAGSLSDSIISNIVHHGGPGDVVTVESGPQYVRNVRIGATLVAT